MDVFKAIQLRHSYRKAFLDKAVPREDLERIVQAGLQAPSGKNAQTTNFIIIDDPEIVKTVGSMHAMEAMQTARALIACLVDKDPGAVYEGYAFQVEDCAAAVENMLLAITDLGYATVWIDGWLRLEDRAQKISEILHVPETKLIRVLLPLGVPKEKVAQKDKRPFAQRAFWNRYGG